MTQSVGGQETPLPAKFYVPLEMALQAAHYFYRHRAPDPALRWTATNFEEGD
ncbi:MAG: Imm1 family immunity protein [Anaerolineales bacterium]